MKHERCKNEEDALNLANKIVKIINGLSRGDDLDDKELQDVVDASADIARWGRHVQRVRDHVANL